MKTKYKLLVTSYDNFTKGSVYNGGSRGFMNKSAKTAKQWAEMLPMEWRVITEFFVGERVECVDADYYLVKGQIYTVTSVDGIGITVKEASVPYGYSYYKANRFFAVNIEVTLSYNDLESLITFSEAVDFICESSDFTDRLVTVRDLIKDN